MPRLARRTRHPRLPRLLLPAILAVLGRPAAAQAAPDTMAMRIERITSGFYVVSGFTNGNILVIERDNDLVLVDAQSAERVALADSAIRTVTDKPVRLVINTHYHADHTAGNAHWRRLGAEAVAHAAVPVQARKDTVIESWHGWHRTPLPDSAIPTRTFTHSALFAHPSADITVFHAPRAHTDGDAVVWFPEANVIHLGDILELGAPPFIDWWAGGTLDGMIATVDTVLTFVTDGTRIVPGHGPVTDRAGLEAYRAMLATLREQIGRAVAEGRSLEETVASRPTGTYAQQLGGERRAEQLTRLIYVGLSAAKAPRRR